MENKQYVIAQEEHDYNKKYEEGTIVKHTIDNNVTTYVAKKNVPRFTSILNENYWKKIASTEEGGTVDYNNLKNKPSVNGVELEGNITTKDLGIDNKFKGWYTSSSALPANPVVGDYAYVKGAESTDPAAIYECTTNGSWSNSGRTADTSNVQTFASSQEVNEVHIVDDLITGGADDVLSAEQGKVLNEQIIYEDQQVVSISPSSNIANGYIVSNGKITTAGSGIFNTDIYDVEDYQGKIITLKPVGTGIGGGSRWYCFYNSKTTIDDTTVVLISSETPETATQNKNVQVPSNALAMAVTEVPSNHWYTEVEYDVVVFIPIKSVISNIQNEVSRLKNETNLIEYVKSGTTITLANAFGNKKIAIKIGQGGANNLIDFRQIFVFDSDSNVSNPLNAEYIISAVGDMHAPFKFRTDNDASNTVFTGGNHAYSAVKTAELEDAKFYADGKLIQQDGEGACLSSIRVEWSNLVKAGNAYSANDPYVLREFHSLTYNGSTFEEWIDLQPLATLRFRIWYGLQLMPVENQSFVMFVGATNREKHDGSTGVISDDKYCSEVKAGNPDYFISMRIDNTFDLGKRDFSNDSTHGAFYTSPSESGKSYFTIISNTNNSMVMHNNEHYWLHGFYSLGFTNNLL